MEIRELKKEDVQTIIEISKEHNKENEKIIKDKYEKNKKLNTDDIKIFQKDYVLIEKNDIVGFCSYKQKNEKNNGIYLLNFICIKKEFENKGYGTILLKYILTKLKEKKARKIYTNIGNQKENKKLINFCKKNEFEIEGKLKNYYRENLDMLILGLDIEKKKTIEKIKNKLLNQKLKIKYLNQK